MTDKFPPGFAFGVPVAGGKPSPSEVEAPPGAGFGVTVKPPEELPPALPARSTPFALRPGEAGFGAPGFPAGFEGPRLPERSDVRMLVEGGGAAAGETLGRRLGPPGAAGGAAVGGFAGSLLANLYDPVKEPIRTAIEAGAVAGGASLAFAGGLVAMRKAVGRPNEAGEWLIAQGEKSGRLPPAGAVFSDSSLITNIQSIGQADILFGQRVTQALEASRGQMTDELRDYLTHYLRVKNEANRAFRRWDKLVESTVGSTGVVPVSPNLLRAAEPLVESWERLGLDTKLGIRLVEKIKVGLERVASKDPIKFEIPDLSLAEAEALRSRLYRAAIDMRRGTVSGKQALGGTEFADAYQAFARDTGKAMDNAIDVQMKQGTMPLQARVELQGARTLWKRWKSGEAMMDEVMLELGDAARQGGPVSSGTMFAALKRLDKLADKSGKSIITTEQMGYMTGIARAMAQAEKSEVQKAFTWTVRAGQLGIITGGASLFGGPGAAGAMFIAATPAFMSWLTTNPRAVRWMIEGMKTEGGTATARRLARNLVAAAAREGLFPPDRAGIGAENVLLDPASQRFAAPLVAQPPGVPQRNLTLPGVNPAFVPSRRAPVRPGPTTPRG